MVIRLGCPLSSRLPDAAPGQLWRPVRLQPRRARAATQKARNAASSASDSRLQEPEPHREVIGGTFEAKAGGHQVMPDPTVPLAQSGKRAN